MRTQLLCSCGGTVAVYQQDDGSLWFPGRTAVDGATVTMTCPWCRQSGTVDATGLRHAIAEQRRKFPIA